MDFNRKLKKHPRKKFSSRKPERKIISKGDMNHE